LGFVPDQHLGSCEVPVLSKAPKGVFHIGVGDCVTPVVSSVEVVNPSNEDDCSDYVLVLLAKEFWHFGMFHLEGKCGLCMRLVIVNLDMNVY
jgi:hypothetical protein